MTEHHEIICITRAGYNFLHGEAIDCAAKVTYIRYRKDERGCRSYDPRSDIIAQMLIPIVR